MLRDNVRRVVTGAVQLPPHLDGRIRASRLLDRSVFVRELLPQGLKFDLETMSGDETVQVARCMARLTGAPTRGS